LSIGERAGEAKEEEKGEAGSGIHFCQVNDEVNSGSGGNVCIYILWTDAVFVLITKSAMFVIFLFFKNNIKIF
jgi:hypothetical protein